MSDWSVRNQNGSGQAIADALLRATGGYTAVLLVPPAVGDTSDAGQIGINAPNFQSLPISPVAFRKLRPTMTEDEQARYELLVSASAVVQQVSLLQLSSADALFTQVAGVVVAGLNLLVEEWASSTVLGEPLVYRLLLRAAGPQSLTVDS
jgi:hypothetical protein